MKIDLLSPASFAAVIGLWPSAAELAAERLNLLETLAARVAERILAEPQAMRVFVRVEKLDRGPGALGVEIVRARAEAPLRAVQADGSEAALHPLVVFLDNAAIAAPDLPARLTALEARGLPLILTVGLPGAGAGSTGSRCCAGRRLPRSLVLMRSRPRCWPG